jgi:hypothetical protein
MELSASILVAGGQGTWSPEICQRQLDRIMRIAHKSFMSYPSTETAAIHQAAWEAYVALTTTKKV